MKIGPYPLHNRLVLAPMAGITDRPFRALCRRFGAALAVSEMVSADTTLWGRGKSLRRLDHQGEAAPVAVQILGIDPGRMAEAARVNAGLGAHIIDINMGCPAKKVCKVSAGSALLRDEALVGRILESVVEAVDIPVTLKIRTGWDRDSRNATRIARIAEAAGIQALAIHGRTRADRFAGAAEYETIAEVKGDVGIPVIANGDIDSPQKAADVLATTGADAIMIGRAAQGRPWIFEEIDHWLTHGRLANKKSAVWIRDLLLEHLEALYGFYGSANGVRVARKHIAWYSRHHASARQLRDMAFKAETASEQKNIVRTFFNRNAKELEEEFAA